MERNRFDYNFEYKLALELQRLYMRNHWKYIKYWYGGYGIIASGEELALKSGIEICIIVLIPVAAFTSMF